MIVREPRILSSEWMLIGQQEVTSHGGRIDLLAIAPDGSLVLIELKRDRTPRETVAQALDTGMEIGPARGVRIEGGDGAYRIEGGEIARVAQPTLI